MKEIDKIKFMYGKGAPFPLNNYNNFKWQKSFYDRTTRNDRELYNIRKDIQQNPFKWELKKEIENIDF